LHLRPVERAEVAAAERHQTTPSRSMSAAA